MEPQFFLHEIKKEQIMKKKKIFFIYAGFAAIFNDQKTQGKVASKINFAETALPSV
jgi:hypothetical protein